MTRAERPASLKKRDKEFGSAFVSTYENIFQLSFGSYYYTRKEG